MLEDQIDSCAYTCFQAVHSKIPLEMVAVMTDRTFGETHIPPSIYLQPTLSLLIQPEHQPGRLVTSFDGTFSLVHKAQVVSSLHKQDTNDIILSSASKYVETYAPSLRVRNVEIIQTFSDRQSNLNGQKVDISRQHFVVLVQIMSKGGCGGDIVDILHENGRKYEDPYDAAALRVYTQHSNTGTTKTDKPKKQQQERMHILRTIICALTVLRARTLHT